MYDFKIQWWSYLETLGKPSYSSGFEAASRAWRMVKRPRAPRGFKFIYNNGR